MKTIGRFSVSTALYLVVSFFWYFVWIVGGAVVAGLIWLLATHSGPEIIETMKAEGGIPELKGLIWGSLVWFKDNPWLSMLVSTVGHVLAWVLGLWVLHHIRRLVRNIESNLIYTFDNMIHSRKTALGIFAGIAVDMAFKKNFEWFSLFVALVALVFVEILRQGIDLAEEQKYTI